MIIIVQFNNDYAIAFDELFERELLYNFMKRQHTVYALCNTKNARSMKLCNLKFKSKLPFVLQADISQSFL